MQRRYNRQKKEKYSCATDRMMMESWRKANQSIAKPMNERRARGGSANYE